MKSRAQAKPRSTSVSKSQADDTRTTVDKLIEHRATIRRWWEDNSNIAPAGLVGLSLSGGGIRSATFSLGLIQALAKDSRRALSKIDIVSSVSGGGYVGCFLRSLFVPDEARGIIPKIGRAAIGTQGIKLNRDAVMDQHEFAQIVLASDPDTKNIQWHEAGGKTTLRRNPLWWLREHSRYLAPNGTADYGYAFAYIARNWLAMLFIFLIGSLALFSTVVLAEAALASRDALIVDWAWLPLGASEARDLPCGRCALGVERTVPISPVILTALFPIVGSIILGIAYWMTQAMSPNEPDMKRQWKNLGIATGGTAVAGAAVIAISAWTTPGALPPNLAEFALQPIGTLFVWVLSAALVLAAVGALLALILAVSISYRGVALTSDLRWRLTNALAMCIFVFFVIAAVAVIDSLGAGVAYWLRSSGAGQTFGGVTTMLLPALAYFIKKLPDWFGGTGKSTIVTLLHRFLNTIALIAGLFLFGMLAVGADALVHLIAWPGRAWMARPDWPILGLFIGVVWVLALLSGTASGFINLSSLHLLYTTRLTRAYLGATNNERLEAAAKDSSSIKDSHKADYIQPQIYSRADLPAPIHVINATINETIDPQSQLVARDRKGNVISLEPAGVRVGNELVDWKSVDDPDCAEQLSLGQWCAISGAAASSGMGRLTNLGFALAFTFANVRLGYWWWSPGVCTAKSAARPIRRTISWLFGTYVYLLNEMTARYSRAYQRKYLTDGGHFENTGAYRLIERQVPLILLTDNGADPKYRFDDLENLVRTIRLDLGGETEVLGGEQLRSFLAELDVVDESVFVDPAESDDWRSQFVTPETTGFVLVLRVLVRGEKLHLIWLKPRVLPGMPADLMGYSAANPQFPQQPTGDQFFDEAQWESYRKLGEFSMARLLTSCPRLLA